MSTLTRGDQLPSHLQHEVLARYIHRWTHENAQRSYNGQCPACRQAGFPAAKVYIAGQALPDGPTYYTQAQWHVYHRPMVSDQDWLKQHAFYITKAGRLDARRTHAEPACLVED